MILGMESAIDDPCVSRTPRGIQHETVKPMGAYQTIIVW